MLERITESVNVDAMQFGSMPGRRTTVVLIAVRMQEEYRDEQKKSCRCFLDIENAFD